MKPGFEHFNVSYFIIIFELVKTIPIETAIGYDSLSIQLLYLLNSQIF